jgi:hypothetical protein
MDAFDVNLLSQVKALNQKMSISQEQLHLKRKAINEDRGKGKHPGRKTARNVGHYEGEHEKSSAGEGNESTIDITI